MSDQKFDHILHSGYFHPVLRQWQSSNATISAENLMFPLFIIDEPDSVTEVQSLPGVCRYGVNKLKDLLEPLVKKGLRSILLFGVPNNIKKDENGTGADDTNNPVIQALPKLKKWFPELIIACDVCLCAYTDHGHCGILHEDGTINNEASIKRLANVALSYAKAGASIVAPSDMMDCRIEAIKKNLSASGLLNKVAVLSYAVKFSSVFYGPFRDASKSAPKFGNRQCYQLPCGSTGLAARAAERDVKEGADMLMVKPGLAYLDIVKQTKEAYPHHPLFIYQVSGEYAMLYHGAKNGAFELEAAVHETILSMRRAGADCIITYFVPLLLDMIQKKL